MQKVWKKTTEWDFHTSISPEYGFRFLRWNIFGDTEMSVSILFGCDNNDGYGLRCILHPFNELPPDSSLRFDCDVFIKCERGVDLHHGTKNVSIPSDLFCTMEAGDLSYEDLGKIKIKCVFEFSRDLSSHVSALVPVGPLTLPLLRERAFSDVVVVCEDKTFNCHKFILAASSEVFKAMLTGDFREARENRIEIKTFQSDVVANLIEFIYEGCVSSEESLTWELFEAAKMYGIDKLQQGCLTTLKNHLSTLDCCKMLEMAYIHDLKEVFSFAKQFFRIAYSGVMETEEWKLILENEPLAKRLLRNVRIDTGMSDSQLRRSARLQSKQI